MKITAYAAALICCVTLGAAIAIEPSGTLFENDQVIVLRALEKAHVKGSFHEHKMNRVMIYLQSGKQRFEYQDGRKPKVFDWKAEQVVWSVPEGMHAGEVLSDDSFNIVEVEIKTPGTGKTITAKLDPVKIDHKHYSVEFENSDVRVVRVKIEPHGTTPMHEHTLNRATIYLTDLNIRATDSHGKVDSVKHKAGEASWGTSLTHTETNMSDQPAEIVSVELKS